MEQVTSALLLFHRLTLAKGLPSSLFNYVSPQTYAVGLTSQATS